MFLHNIQNIQDTIQHYSTYREGGNLSLQVEKKRSADSVTKMLEFSDKDFKATIIIMILSVRASILETNGKIEASAKQ